MADQNRTDEQKTSSLKEKEPRRSVNWFVISGAFGLVLAVIASIFFANRFVENERSLHANCIMETNPSVMPLVVCISLPLTGFLPHSVNHRMM